MTKYCTQGSLSFKQYTFHYKACVSMVGSSEHIYSLVNLEHTLER